MKKNKKNIKKRLTFSVVQCIIQIMKEKRKKQVIWCYWKKQKSPCNSLIKNKKKKGLKGGKNGI